MKSLTLYIDPTLSHDTARVSPLVYPLWNSQANKTISFGKAFTQHPFDTTYYSVTEDPDSCDCHLWPFNYWATIKKPESKKKLDEAYANAHAHGKKLLIDAFGDTMSSVPYPDAIILRFAQYRRNLCANDIILPAYIEDLLETYRQGKCVPRQKSETPTVGFVGWGTLPFQKHIRSYIKELPVFLWSLVYRKDGIFRKGVFLRAQALKALMSSPGVQTRFLIRGSYSGHVQTAEKGLEELRREFVDNIDMTDYTLCQKGDANQSTRIFEVLSMGRIPLVIDTECVFPLQHMIDYTSCCVIVAHEQCHDIGAILERFHRKLSPEAFVRMQECAREVFEDYLRIDAFTPFLVEEIRRRIS
jgi:hypothetical protein